VNGITVLIDDQDAGIWNRFRWHANMLDSRPDRVIKKKYIHAAVYLGMKNGKQQLQTVYLHRLIMGAAKGQTVDHINGNTLDNRRSNLRFATRSQQNMNKGVPSNNTSGFKGAYLDKRDQRWAASIWINGEKKSLGYHDAAEDAARAYDRAARELFGEFASLNFPDAK
jgi:hypothetical protein